MVITNIFNNDHNPVFYFVEVYYGANMIADDIQTRLWNNKLVPISDIIPDWVPLIYLLKWQEVCIFILLIPYMNCFVIPNFSHLQQSYIPLDHHAAFGLPDVGESITFTEDVSGWMNVKNNPVTTNILMDLI